MRNAFAMKRLNTDAKLLTFYWQGKPISAQDSDTVASALLAAGIRSNRDSIVSGQPRAPFCMMGSCFECLIEIDGVLRQSCMTPVRDDMRVNVPAKNSEDSL